MPDIKSNLIVMGCLVCCVMQKPYSLLYEGGSLFVLQLCMYAQHLPAKNESKFDKLLNLYFPHSDNSLANCMNCRGC